MVLLVPCTKAKFIVGDCTGNINFTHTSHMDKESKISTPGPNPKITNQLFIVLISCTLVYKRLYDCYRKVSSPVHLPIRHELFSPKCLMKVSLKSKLF